MTLTNQQQYFATTQDSAYSSWSDSELKQWLVSHDIIKSDAQLQREKLEKLIGDNYSNAKDTIWAGWTDSAIREWLVEHGYLRTDAQKTRDELVGLINEKYGDAASRSAAYLTWPDARLRAYLREHGLPEDGLPTSRPGLLRMYPSHSLPYIYIFANTCGNVEETRIRWVQTQNRTESLFAKIRDIILGGVGSTEAKLATILDIITGHAESAKTRAEEKVEEGKAKADEAAGYAGQKYEEGKGYANEKAREAGEKGAEYESAGKKYWNEKVEDVQRGAGKAKVEL